MRFRGQRLIVSLVGLLVVSGLLVSCHGQKESKPQTFTADRTSSIQSTSASQKLLKHTTLVVPDVGAKVILNRKTGSTIDFTHGPKQFAVHGTVTLLTDDVKPLGNGSIVGLIAVNPGGSGTFVYLALFAPNKDGYKMQAYRLLGDRINIVSLKVDSDNSVYVVYKKHGLTQPMSDAPSVVVKKKYSYKSLLNHDHL